MNKQIRMETCSPLLRTRWSTQCGRRTHLSFVNANHCKIISPFESIIFIISHGSSWRQQRNGNITEESWCTRIEWVNFCCVFTFASYLLEYKKISYQNLCYDFGAVYVRKAEIYRIEKAFCCSERESFISLQKKMVYLASIVYNILWL